MIPRQLDEIRDVLHEDGPVAAGHYVESLVAEVERLNRENKDLRSKLVDVCRNERLLKTVARPEELLRRFEPTKDVPLCRPLCSGDFEE